MSITGAASIYEKMLQNPDNRKSSSGSIKQPTPYDTGASLPVSVPKSTGEDLTSEEAAYLASIDSRMALRAAGKPVNESKTTGDISRIAILEREVSELKELMTEMMKTHMKLLGERK